MQNHNEVPAGLDDLTPEELAFVMGGMDHAPQPQNFAQDDGLGLNEVEQAWLERSMKEENEQQAKLEKMSLFGAIKNHDLETLRALICSGVDLRVLNEARQDVFDYAIQKDAADVLKILVSVDESRQHETDQFGNYLVHTAAVANAVNCMEVLRLAGSKLNRTNKHGNCPLLFSIQNHKMDMAEYLIRVLSKEQPVDPEQQSRVGYFPTVNACTLRLDSINFKHDLVLLRTFTHHALASDRNQDQKITWRDFTMIALALQKEALKNGNPKLAEEKLLLAKRIAMVELLCQKVHLSHCEKMNGHTAEIMGSQIEKMIANLMGTQDKELENPQAVVKLCSQLRLLTFSSRPITLPKDNGGILGDKSLKM